MFVGGGGWGVQCSGRRNRRREGWAEVAACLTWPNSLRSSSFIPLSFSLKCLRCRWGTLCQSTEGRRGMVTTPLYPLSRASRISLSFRRPAYCTAVERPARGRCRWKTQQKKRRAVAQSRLGLQWLTASFCLSRSSFALRPASSLAASLLLSWIMLWSRSSCESISMLVLICNRHGHVVGGISATLEVAKRQPILLTVEMLIPTGSGR